MEGQDAVRKMKQFEEAILSDSTSMQEIEAMMQAEYEKLAHSLAQEAANQGNQELAELSNEIASINGNLARELKRNRDERRERGVRLDEADKKATELRRQREAEERRQREAEERRQREAEERKMLQEELQRLRDRVTSDECNICMENPRTVAFLCGHQACGNCAQALVQCHMCRKPIQARIQLYK